MLGVTTAMFFLAWGGQLATAYGTRNLLIGMIFGTVFIGGVALLLARISSATGLDSDLITRGSGFGFMGSAFTSLIYSFNFLMFFAFEGTIMSTAVHDRWPAVPIWLLYLLIGLVFIPLTWWGLTVMNWVMWVTTPLYLGFLAWTIYLASTSAVHVPFWSYSPATATNPTAGPALLQVLAAVLALISQATIAADVGRFIPAERRTSGAITVGLISQLLTFLGVTMLGAWFTLSFSNSTNPGAYLAALMGVWGVIFVVITQLRINVTNVYSGSLAYANFFCRVFHITPGRHYWVILTSVLGTALMFGGVFAHLTAVLTFEGVFIMGWVMAILTTSPSANRWGCRRKTSCTNAPTPTVSIPSGSALSPSRWSSPCPWPSDWSGRWAKHWPRLSPAPWRSSPPRCWPWPPAGATTSPPPSPATLTLPCPRWGGRSQPHRLHRNPGNRPRHLRGLRPDFRAGRVRPVPLPPGSDLLGVLRGGRPLQGHV